MPRADIGGDMGTDQSPSLTRETLLKAIDQFADMFSFREHIAGVEMHFGQWSARELAVTRRCSPAMTRGCRVFKSRLPAPPKYSVNPVFWDMLRNDTKTAANP